MPLSGLDIVLFRPKYAENVGSAARAMLNMGCGRLTLVGPLGSDLPFAMDNALPLATVHARHILEGARTVDELPEALAGCGAVYGTTARTGGWRKGSITPAQAAGEIMERLRGGERAALVFGPEDRGLTNAETSLCNRLVRIPTHTECSSLNLSQAVMVLLYECFQKSLEAPFVAAGPPGERDASFEEREKLFGAMTQALLAIDFLKDQNTEYWMLPVKRFFGRFRLKRNEFNLLMGICRQVRNVASRGGTAEKKIRCQRR